jgi:hypothetical protein
LAKAAAKKAPLVWKMSGLCWRALKLKQAISLGKSPPQPSPQLGWRAWRVTLFHELEVVVWSAILRVSQLALLSALE